MNKKYIVTLLIASVITGCVGGNTASKVQNSPESYSRSSNDASLDKVNLVGAGNATQLNIRFLNNIKAPNQEVKVNLYTEDIKKLVFSSEVPCSDSACKVIIANQNLASQRYQVVLQDVGTNKILAATIATIYDLNNQAFGNAYITNFSNNKYLFEHPHDSFAYKKVESSSAYNSIIPMTQMRAEEGGFIGRVTKILKSSFDDMFSFGLDQAFDALFGSVAGSEREKMKENIEKSLEGITSRLENMEGTLESIKDDIGELMNHQYTSDFEESWQKVADQYKHAESGITGYNSILDDYNNDSKQRVLAYYDHISTEAGCDDRCIEDKLNYLYKNSNDYISSVRILAGIEENGDLSTFIKKNSELRGYFFESNYGVKLDSLDDVKNLDHPAKSSNVNVGKFIENLTESFGIMELKAKTALTQEMYYERDIALLKCTYPNLKDTLQFSDPDYAKLANNIKDCDQINDAFYQVLKEKGDAISASIKTQVDINTAIIHKILPQSISGDFIAGKDSSILLNNDSVITYGSAKHELKFISSALRPNIMGGGLTREKDPVDINCAWNESLMDKLGNDGLHYYRCDGSNNLTPDFISDRYRVYAVGKEVGFKKGFWGDTVFSALAEDTSTYSRTLIGGGKSGVLMLHTHLKDIGPSMGFIPADVDTPIALSDDVSYSQFGAVTYHTITRVKDIGVEADGTVTINRNVIRYQCIQCRDSGDYNFSPLPSPGPIIYHNVRFVTFDRSSQEGLRVRFWQEGSLANPSVEAGTSIKLD